MGWDLCNEDVNTSLDQSFHTRPRCLGNSHFVSVSIAYMPQMMILQRLRCVCSVAFKERLFSPTEHGGGIKVAEVLWLVLARFFVLHVM